MLARLLGDSKYLMKPVDRRQIAAAAAEALTGLMIALILSAIVFATPLRKSASDLSQKVLLAIGTSGGALGEGAQPLGAPVSNWVFVDLAGRFCHPGGKPPRCPPDRRVTDRRALAGLVAGIRAQGPRVIVLDVGTVPGDPQEDEALRAVLRAPGRPILLVWAPNPVDVAAGEDGETALPFPAHGFWCDPRACAEFPDARYLPALTEHSDGPFLRRIGTVYRVNDERGPYRVPGVALGAALVAAAPRDRPWTLLDGFAASSGSGDMLSGCTPPRTRACLQAFGRTDRVFSFSPIDVGDGDPSATGGNVNFVHQLPGDDAAQMDGLRDAVVVIGNASPAQRDRGWGAAGSVSGAELILNDTRQLLVAPPGSGLGLMGYLLGEWAYLLAGLVTLFMVALFYPQRRGRKPAEPGLAAAKAYLAAGSHALGKLACVAVVNLILFALILWAQGVAPGGPPDLISPFLGVLIEAAFDALHQFANGLHALIHRLLGGTATRKRKKERTE